jgi:hypothetical protein
MYSAFAMDAQALKVMYCNQRVSSFQNKNFVYFILFEILPSNCSVFQLTDAVNDADRILW